MLCDQMGPPPPTAQSTQHYRHFFRQKPPLGWTVVTHDPGIKNFMATLPACANLYPTIPKLSSFKVRFPQKQLLRVESPGVLGHSDWVGWRQDISVTVGLRVQSFVWPYIP